jgi:hypothetical protein
LAPADEVKKTSEILKNKESCWSAFHGSGHSLGIDHHDLITRVQDRFRVAATAVGHDLDSESGQLSMRSSLQKALNIFHSLYISFAISAEGVLQRFLLV